MIITLKIGRAKKYKDSHMEEQEDKSKLYVGNLPYSVDDNELSRIFSEVEGVKVVEAKVITDKYNPNRSKGFGFVTCETPEMADAAIKAMNGKDVGGRSLTVNVARPRRSDDRGRV